eukprot:TRINITY_DN10070_c0_g1_i1.p2 TRINITY_DN10070_c0_g1~~TRINITY_DN10070_c0_g1_i1.p2  ORF type:complete len:285 (-),score=48.84 TRINITY_DN10070_c0_g1_i1:851-1705(-)
MCEECNGIYSHVTNWVQGEWKTGKMLPMKWIKRNVEILRSMESGIRFLDFESAVQEAIMTQVGPSFATNSICLYYGISQMIKIIACDCSTNCTLQEITPDLTLRYVIGVLNFCAFVPSFTKLNGVILSNPEGAVLPKDLCKVVEISSRPQSLYQIKKDTPLASASFFPKDSDPNAIVYNQNYGLVGQICSNGIGVVWSGNLSEPLTLCIEISNQPVPKFMLQGLGIYNSTTKVTFLKILDVWPAQEKDYVCGNISEPGIYFVVWYEPNWKDLSDYGNYSNYVML